MDPDYANGNPFGWVLYLIAIPVGSLAAFLILLAIFRWFEKRSR